MFFYSSARPSSGGVAIHGAVAIMVAIALVLVGSTPASALSVKGGENLLDTQEAVIQDGASDDVREIASAAESYEQGDSESTVGLVDAAAAAEGIDVDEVGQAVLVAGHSGTVAELTESGAAVTTTDGFELSISVDLKDSPSEPELTEGVAVLGQVAPSTEVVSRVTEGGIQLLAVLADSSAPAAVEFDVEVPEGGALVERADGSIAVTVTKDEVIFDEVDSERFDSEVAAIVGDVTELDQISDAQWDAIDAIEPAAGTVSTTVETVAIISPAWAVDANGDAVETHYELDGTSLTQVILTDENTAFPVVADPSASFWWKAAKCVGELALLTAAAIKAIAMVAKLIKFINGLDKASKVAKAWKSIVGTGSNVDGFKKLAKALGQLLEKLAKEGWDAMKRHMGTTATLTAAGTILVNAGDTLAEIIGIKNCVDLAWGRY